MLKVVKSLDNMLFNLEKEFRREYQTYYKQQVHYKKLREISNSKKL